MFALFAEPTRSIGGSSFESRAVLTSTKATVLPFLRLYQSPCVQHGNCAEGFGTRANEGKALPNAPLLHRCAAVCFRFQYSAVPIAPPIGCIQQHGQHSPRSARIFDEAAPVKFARTEFTKRIHMLLCSVTDVFSKPYCGNFSAAAIMYLSLSTFATMLAAAME